MKPLLSFIIPYLLLLLGAKAAETKTVTDADRATVVDGHAVRTTGAEYNNNNYHFLFTIRDGVIVAIREYHDTHYAAGVWSDFSTMPGSAG